MNIIRGAITVFLFECRRALTPARLACWCVLVLFPPVVVGLIRHFGGAEVDQDWVLVWSATMFFLIPEVVCLLGLLLWATPAIHSELEGQTWIYLAVRPDGKRSVLLGKYLTAAAWTAAAGLLASTLSVVVAQPEEATLLLGSLYCLVILSSLTYGAIYLFIGVLFLKRAMVIAVFYTLVLELTVAFIPAVINQFTVQFRLRSLMFQWMQPAIDGEVPESEIIKWFSLSPPIEQIAILLAITVLLLTASVTVLEQRQLTTVTEV